MIKMIKLILKRYVDSYLVYLEKFCKKNILFLIILIPIFSFVYLMTFLVLLIIVSIVIFLAKPISMVYKPHIKSGI